MKPASFGETVGAKLFRANRCAQYLQIQARETPAF